MKLQVGDIRMDSDSGVSFGAPSRPIADAVDTSLLDAAAHAPWWAYALVCVGAGTLAVLLGAAALLSDSWVLVLPALVAARLSAFATMAAVGPFASSPRVEEVADARSLMKALESRREARVEQLCAETGWPERRVVRALIAMIERGEVEEDLDIETGRWTYRKTTALTGVERRVTLSAADRLRAIEREHTQEARIED